MVWIKFKEVKGILVLNFNKNFIVTPIYINIITTENKINNADIIKLVWERIINKLSFIKKIANGGMPAKAKRLINIKFVSKKFITHINFLLVLFISFKFTSTTPITIMP